MKYLPTREDLIAFEENIGNSFNNKEIRAPIHLNWGDELEMLDIFKEINENDWCIGNWRTHYLCLLKGVPKEKLKERILKGHSISLCFKDYNIVSSAIVGTSLSIATGIALDIKRKKQDKHVWCFTGEMSASLGIFFECYNYSKNFDLPITFVVQDNGQSVCTDTRSVWGCDKLPFEPDEVNQDLLEEHQVYKSKYLYYYKYNLKEKYPHSGPGGKRIQF